MWWTRRQGGEECMGCAHVQGGEKLLGADGCGRLLCVTQQGEVTKMWEAVYRPVLWLER